MSFFEWINPLFSSGHWTPELIRMAGGIDGYSFPGSPSRRLDWGEVLRCQPEAIVISCCGFDICRTVAEIRFLEAKPGWSSLPAINNRAVFIADGRVFFSRPGPRLVDSG
ncbi:MAG: hypothetical protein NZL96_03585 [Patescibacteria group bacterium]|nr:hypothetical protein [Patescibacteria group bacterium]